jgi:hypothetical protein
MHVNPYIFTATVILIIVYILMRRKRMAAEGRLPRPKPKPSASAQASAPRPPKPERPPEEVFKDLRQQAFATPPDSVGGAGQFAPDEPYGGMMEMWLSDSIISLACFANGDASFVFNTGGGMTGGGVHEPVRKAAQMFVGVVQKAMAAMSPASEQPLPVQGHVRFYALTPHGIHTAETGREDLGDDGGALSALFYAGQEVVAQMRKIQEQRSR